MSADPCPSLEERLDLLASEILAWNSQINLVTRQDTGRKLGMMIQHCRDGWKLAQGALGADSRLRTYPYVDLGTGAGLPGLVWAALRAHEGHDGPCFLIEPRDKRAWFLRRTARALALPDVRVISMRWGDAPLTMIGYDGSPMILSLKALRLNDRQVLAGALVATSAEEDDTEAPSEVLLLRFLAPAAMTRQHGKWPGEAPVAGCPERRVEDLGGRSYCLQESRILGSGAPRLSLKRYTAND